LLAASNDLIRQLTPLITARQGLGGMTALLPPAADQRKSHDVEFGGLTFSATYERLESPGLADGVINEGRRPPGEPYAAARRGRSSFNLVPMNSFSAHRRCCPPSRHRLLAIRRSASSAVKKAPTWTARGITFAG